MSKNHPIAALFSRALKLYLPSSQIPLTAIEAEADPCFMVVGNFATQTNEFGAPINIESGINNLSFVFAMADICERYGFKLIHNFNNSVVIRAEKAAMPVLKMQMGHRFSYACTNDQGIQRMVAAEEDYQQNAPLAGIEIDLKVRPAPYLDA